MTQIAEGLLPYKLEIAPDADATVTAYAGLPVVLETLRSLRLNHGYRRLAAALEIRNGKVVRRHVESLVLLIAAGGECIDDLLHLRADGGLKALLHFEPSSPTQAKELLYLFHQAEDGHALTDDDDAALSVSGQARIRPEGPGLRGLAALLDAVVGRVQRLQRKTSATLDVDATIIEAHKRRALWAYEGTRGYQPQMAWWAEQRLWVCDEFRDGNVPAAYAVKAYLQKAFGTLPASVTTRRLRGDSALYDQEGLTWAEDQGIEFAVSADMSEALRKEVMALHEPAWQPYRSLRDDATEDRQWAEVVFVPDWPRNHKREGEPLRYLAIRVRSKQHDLFVEDAARWRHFAVVTNMSWDGERLLRWQREKQGTVEHGHGILKNELAGGTLPCGRFGANAAWWRLNVLVHNLLTLLQTVLPESMQSARPKALRFRLLNVAAHIVHHARTLVLRLSSRLPAARIYAAARQALRDLAAAYPAEPQGA